MLPFRHVYDMIFQCNPVLKCVNWCDLVQCDFCEGEGSYRSMRHSRYCLASGRHCSAMLPWRFKHSMYSCITCTLANERPFEASAHTPHSMAPAISTTTSQCPVVSVQCCSYCMNSSPMLLRDPAISFTCRYQTDHSVRAWDKRAEC